MDIEHTGDYIGISSIGIRSRQNQFAVAQLVELTAACKRAARGQDTGCAGDFDSASLIEEVDIVR